MKVKNNLLYLLIKERAEVIMFNRPQIRNREHKFVAIDVEGD